MNENPIIFYVVVAPKDEKHPIAVYSKDGEVQPRFKVIDHREYEKLEAKIRSLAVQADVIIAALKSEIETLKDVKNNEVIDASRCS